MIKVNLLPLEKRRKDRTPLPRFLVIIASVVIFLLLLVWDIQMVSKTKSIQKTLNNRKGELALLQEELIRFGPLKKEEQQLLAWKDAAEFIKNSRPFLWWQKVDILWDIFEEFPKIWITSFKLTHNPSSSGSGKRTEASINFNCKSFSIEEIDKKIMTDFHRKLQDTPELMEDFNGGVTKPIEFKATELQSSGTTEENKKWLLQFKIELTRLKTTKSESQP